MAELEKLQVELQEAVRESEKLKVNSCIERVGNTVSILSPSCTFVEEIVC